MWNVFIYHKKCSFIFWQILIFFFHLVELHKVHQTSTQNFEILTRKLFMLIYAKVIMINHKNLLLLHHLLINFNSVSSIYVTNIIHYSVNWAEIKNCVKFLCEMPDEHHIIDVLVYYYWGGILIMFDKGAWVWGGWSKRKGWPK